MRRTYYLAAETEAEMNKWVMTLCQVLGLAETGIFLLTAWCLICRARPMYTSDIENQQHRSIPAHRQIFSGNLPMSLLITVLFLCKLLVFCLLSPYKKTTHYLKLNTYKRYRIQCKTTIIGNVEYAQMFAYSLYTNTAMPTITTFHKIT